MNRIGVRKSPWLLVGLVGLVGTSIFDIAVVYGVGAMRRPTVVIAAPDGRRVAAQDGAEIVIWDGHGRQLARIASRAPFRAALAGHKLAGVFDEGLGIRFGEGYGKLLLLRDPPPFATLRRVFLSANGRLVAVLHRGKGLAGDADAISFWDALSGRRRGMRRVRSGRRLLDVAVRKDGRFAAICGDRGRREAFCQLLRIKKGVEQVGAWRSRAHGTVYSADMGPAGKRLAISAAGEILILSLPRLKVLARQRTAALAPLFPARLRRHLDPFPAAHLLRFSHGGDELLSFHGTRVVGVGRWRLSGLVARVWLPRPRNLKGAIKQLFWGTKGEIFLLAGAGGLAVQRYRERGQRFEPTLRFVPGAATR